MTNSGPIIYQNQPPVTAPRFSWPFFLFRLMIIFLILCITFVLFQGLSLLINNLQNPNSQSVALPFSKPARISLSPPQTDTSTNQEITLSIDYYSGSKTIQGIDLVIKYDPNLLDLDSSNFFSQGPIFKEYPIIQADTNSGIIKISAIATPTQIGFSGNGQIGNLKFTTKSSGKTQVTIEFEPNATTESNMVELSTGNELLEQVQDATINIR